MAETNEEANEEQVAEAAKNVEVAAHAMANAVLELQRLTPEAINDTELAAKSGGSCAFTSCFFDPV